MIKAAMDFGISCIIVLAAKPDVVFKEKLAIVYSWTAMIPQYRILLSCTVINTAFIFLHK